jgi:ABC-type polysaccharide/polyol phosphate export permease
VNDQATSVAEATRPGGLTAAEKRALEPKLGALLKEGVQDLIEGAMSWRIWVHLGMTDIRVRYRRSFVGQNWQTLSMAILLLAITVIYSGLLNVDPRTYVVYVVCAFACWTLISSLVVESSNAFIASEGIMRHYSMPKSVYLYQLVLRNLAVFAHNVVLVVPVFILAGHPFSWTMILIVPALVIYAINGVWIAAVLGALSARFRDVPQAIGSAMHICFILTPVVYTVDSMGQRQRFIADWNPFARMLAVGRDPLMGKVPSVEDVVIVLAITFVGCLVGLYVFAQTRRRILYWL